MRLHKIRIALAAIIMALTAVSAVDSASAFDPGTPRVVSSAYVNATAYDEDLDGMDDESQDPDLGLSDLGWGGP